MLRITEIEEGGSKCLRVEGRLCGPWVDLLGQSCRQCRGKDPAHPVRLNVDGVTIVDNRGRKLLQDLEKAGTVLEAPSSFLREVLDHEAVIFCTSELTEEEVRHATRKQRVA